MPLAERQRAFGTALLDASLPMPEGLVGPDGKPSVRRFSVYRNNVVVGLVESLKNAYPAVHRIVGDEFFQAMTRVYVAATPPLSPILLNYGAGFAEFIEGFEPASSLAYLSDVARIERAWVEAYHSAEATALHADDLMYIEPDRLHSICFAIHPSLRIVRSPMPVLTIWRMNVGEGRAKPIDPDAGGEDTLVVRLAATVSARRIPSGGAEFIEHIAAGHSVTEAAMACMKTTQSFDLAGNLSDLLDAGAFVSWRFVDETGHEGAQT